MGTVGTETPTTMKRPIHFALLYTLVALAPTGVMAEEGAQAGHTPLDLSLPKDTQSRTWGEPLSRDATRLPELGGQPEGPGSRGGARGAGSGPRTDLPYGAGYEARHGTGSGWGAGGGAGGGAGRRGGGRGR